MSEEYKQRRRSELNEISKQRTLSKDEALELLSIITDGIDFSKLEIDTTVPRE